MVRIPCLFLIPPGSLGTEFVKTKGHYHQKKPGTNISYPELYEVLEGEAIYLFQKEEDSILKDVIMIKAIAGDKVIVPPNYGHITINPSDKILKMANWVCSNFSSEYENIEKKCGGAYFVLINGIIFPNKKYGVVPVLRFIHPPDLSRFGIKKGEALYDLINKPQVLKFLTYPEGHNDIFSGMTDY